MSGEDVVGIMAIAGLMFGIQAWILIFVLVLPELDKINDRIEDLDNDELRARKCTQ